MSKYYAATEHNAAAIVVEAFGLSALSSLRDEKRLSTENVLDRYNENNETVFTQCFSDGR